MPLLLLLEDIGDSHEDARLLYVAKLAIDRRAEHAHRRRKSHICIDQRRYLLAMLTDKIVQNLEILLICLLYTSPSPRDS